MSDCNFHFSEETKKFAVVEFLNENTVEAVPLSWVIEDKRGKQLCYWPGNMSGVEIKNYVKVSHIPDGSWPRYTVKILARCSEFSSVFCTPPHILLNRMDLFTLR